MSGRDDELVYAGRVAARMNLVWLTTQRFSHLQGEMAVHDERWRMESGGLTIAWGAILADCRAAEPPARFGAFHGRALAMLELLTEAGRGYRRVFLEGDAEAVDRADSALESYLVAMFRLRNEANELLH
jgi:hypothetical protein